MIDVPGTRVLSNWMPGEMERVYSFYINATGKHPDGEKSITIMVNMRYLRDANRNGIPDMYEEFAQNPFILSDIPDISILSSEKLQSMHYYAMKNLELEGDDVKWPVRYGLGMHPPGVRLHANAQGNEKGEQAKIDGKINLEWAEHEMSRKVRVFYTGEDSDGKTAQNAMDIKVLRDDDADGMPDGLLSIAAIPPRMIVEGESIKPIPITVRSSLPDPVELGVFAGVFYIKDDLPHIVFLGPADYNLELVKLSEGPSFAQEKDVKLHHYEIRGKFRFPSDLGDYGWGKNQSVRRLYLQASAWSGEYSSEPMDLSIMVLRSGDKEDPRVKYQFVPIPDITVYQTQEIPTVKLQMKQGNEDIRFLTSELPSGLSFNKENNTITGSIAVGEWQDWEADRRYSVTAYAVYKPEWNKTYEFDDPKVIAIEQFYITVLPEVIDMGKGVAPIADQTVLNHTVIKPIMVRGEHDTQLAGIRLEGMPAGIRGGPGGFIEGAVNIYDWEEGESIRGFNVTVEASFKTVPKAHRDGVPTIQIADTATTSFTMHVLRDEPSGWTEGDELVPLAILNIPQQDMQNGEAIAPIIIQVQDISNSGVEIHALGLPPGLVHEPEGEIHGTPAVEDWGENEFTRIYHITIKVMNGLGQETSSIFKAAISREGVTDENPPIPDPDEAPPSEYGDMPPSESGDMPPSEWGDMPPAEEPPAEAPPAEEPPAEAPPAEEPPAEVPPAEEPPAEVPPAEEPIEMPDDIPEDIPEDPADNPLEALLPPPVVIAAKEGLTIAIAQGEQSQHQEKILHGIFAGLNQAGYRPGDNITVEYYLADEENQTVGRIAEQLRQKDYALVIAIGEPMAQTAQQALEGRNPLVFVDVADPVAAGLTGSVTGIIASLAPHQLLNAIGTIQPNAMSIAYLYAQAADYAANYIKEAEGDGMLALAAAVTDPAALVQEGMTLLETAELLIVNQEFEDEESLKQLIEAAKANGKPVYGLHAAQLDLGAAAVITTDAANMGARSGLLAARILSGENAANIPYETPRRYQILLNFDIIQELGL